MIRFTGSRSGVAAGRRRRTARLKVATAVVAAACAFIAAGPFAATAQAAPACTIHSLPSFVQQGTGSTEASVADIVEVTCESTYAGDTVKVSSTQLDSACGGNLSWSLPYPYAPQSGSGITVKLAGAGDATVALWGGPNCTAGTYSIVVQMEQSPFETLITSFEVVPKKPTSEGVLALPSTQVEDKVHGSVATIVEVAFPGDGFAAVRLAATQLYSRCLATPHLAWIGPDATVLASSAASLSKVALDVNGNAFVVLLGGASCKEGSSVVEADLETAPFTTNFTEFTVKAAPANPAAPSATIKSPANGKSFEAGTAVTTSFSCTEGTGGPGLESCTDSNGGSGTSGQLDTATVGPHVYTVTATSKDELAGTAQISYTVIVRPSSVYLAYKSAVTVGPIERGDPIHFHTTRTQFTTSGATIQCPDGQFTGSALTNELRTDQFEVTGGATFDGGPAGGPCTSAALGNVSVNVTAGRWPGTFKTTGAEQLSGSPNLIFSLSYGAGVLCHYAMSRVNGAFNTDGNPITVTNTRQPFKLDTTFSNSRGCPKSGTLTAAWQLTTTLPGSTEELPIILAKHS